MKYSSISDKLIYFLYDTLLFLVSPFLVGYHLYRSLLRSRPVALAERFGFLNRCDLAKIVGHDSIWVHAVSVGETIAVKSLLKSLKERFPEKKIVLSNVTETGRSVAAKLEDVDLCIYFPFDYGFAVKKAFQAISPCCIILMETEIWPNFLRFANLGDIPVILVNGRISDRSFKRYLQFKCLFRHFLANISAFCMQTGEDARRIIAMGAQSSTVTCSGNLKYDIAVPPVTAEYCRERKEAYHIPQDVSVLTVGSTHQGEEETLVAAYKTLVAESRSLFLVLVPRHPERAASVAELLRREGLSYTLRSELDKKRSLFQSGEVLLVDSVGELMQFYALSDLVFVGGSLVPVGGHNILEPASLCKPVLFGPHMSNFREITSLILEFGGGLQVADTRQLESSMRLLLDDSEQRIGIGKKGARLLEENCGSTERHMEIISSFIKKPR